MIMLWHIGIWIQHLPNRCGQRGYCDKNMRKRHLRTRKGQPLKHAASDKEPYQPPPWHYCWLPDGETSLRLLHQNESERKSCAIRKLFMFMGYEILVLRVQIHKNVGEISIWAFILKTVAFCALFAYKFIKISLAVCPSPFQFRS